MFKTNTITKHLNNDRGSIAVLAAFFIMLLLAISGLIIDSGHLAYNRIRLDEATNHAAEAIIQGIDYEASEEYGQVILDKESVGILVDNILYANLPEATLVSCEVDPVLMDRVKVKTKLEVEVFFSKIFGVETLTMYSESTGKVISD